MTKDHVVLLTVVAVILLAVFVPIHLWVNSPNTVEKPSGVPAVMKADDSPSAGKDVTVALPEISAGHMFGAVLVEAFAVTILIPFLLIAGLSGGGTMYSTVRSDRRSPSGYLQDITTTMIPVGTYPVTPVEGNVAGAIWIVEVIAYYVIAYACLHGCLLRQVWAPLLMWFTHL